MANPSSRRRFVRDVSLGLGAALLSHPLLAACTPRDKKLGIALVGLGSYAGGQLAPALQHTNNCYLAGIVTGTPAKEKIWADKYKIPAKNIYNYENFDRIADNPDIDIVYVVLPVFLHKEFTIRAAKAGKHVICEKPMALSVAECDEMITACKQANRLLSIGYRLHFEPFNKEMMRLGQQKVYGPVQSIHSSNGFVYGGTDNSAWRLKKKLAGGGPLMDMGVYVVQGTRYVTGEEPLWVKARQEKTRPDFFNEVEETVYWQMAFPGGCIADCKTSYNENASILHANASKGWFELQPAYGYGGLAGKTSDGNMPFPQIVQQAAQMDAFATAVHTSTPSIVPGEEGRKDMLVVEAIYRSLDSGQQEKVGV